MSGLEIHPRFSEALYFNTGDQRLLSGLIRIEYIQLRHSRSPEQSLASDRHWALYVSTRVVACVSCAVSCSPFCPLACLVVRIPKTRSTLAATCAGNSGSRSMKTRASFIVPLRYSGVAECGGFWTGLGDRDRAFARRSVGVCRRGCCRFGSIFS
ncbi:hypothetical protein T440DRAFT_326387 [Plenodomus tracheiphilus IPT5]|uniref:Uncharacterized protein n=1 Tax=Plenodomus tracheiphilus IPT5 TaxID=1408161 RepID=A0A6A7AML7_9PLEO|nr:hypothetical protein T440DRAFT_326387 [Plenodomus tracheiphilus IPT5]